MTAADAEVEGLRILVCVKRVPDASSTVVLTEDAQSVDGRYVGFTLSKFSQWPKGRA